MESSSSEMPESQPRDSKDAPVLQVDFSWRKFKSLVSERDNPSEPLYIVDYKFLSPHLVFRSATDESETIGTGTLHAVSINANYELRGQKGKLKALKRWQTTYTHLSHAYSDNNDSPVTMTWTSDSNFKTWDFVCMDENQMPVARCSANLWAMKKIGHIEFLGPKARSPAARDEILVIGLTLVYCMVLRASSLVSFFGAFFASPGPIKDDGSTQSKQKDLDDGGGSTPREEEAARGENRQSAA